LDIRSAEEVAKDMSREDRNLASSNVNQTINAIKETLGRLGLD